MQAYSDPKREKSNARVSRKLVHQSYWVEPSTEAERVDEPESPYRMCTDGGQRFGLSTLDAIRAQKQGLPFVSPAILNAEVNDASA
jgi:hypothetical protein